MSQIVEREGEIDLGELLAAIWSNFWIVFLTMLAVTFFAGYFAFVSATPEYRASTRFELLDDEQSGGDLGQVAGLAALAGFGISGAISEAAAIEDRVLSRPFVESIYEKAEFATDPAFNYTLREPGFISKVIEVLRGSSEEQRLDRDDYLVMAIGGLRERMLLMTGDNGIIELTITHPDGARAAQVANVIVEQSLLDIFERERSQTRGSLDYFADELLQVRSDLDAANASVRDYAITNNLQSAEELARTSAQLAQVRRDIEVIEESLLALEAMRESDFSGTDFAESHPVSTSLSFRRLMSLSGDPNNWVPPSEEEIAQAAARLVSQKSPLVSTFNALEERAKSSGAEALELAALEREVAVQQAIYESVITQFEARSLISGFERASGRIVETAIAPNRPASPNKPLIVVLGIVFGLLLGATIALVVSFKRGLLYTHAAIRRAANLQDSCDLILAKLGRLDNQELKSRQLVAAQDFFVALHDNDQVIPVITTSSERLSARFVLSLSKTASLLGEHIAIFDLSEGALGKIERRCTESDSNGFRKSSLLSHVDLLVATDKNSFLKPLTCAKQIEALRAAFDRVFIILPLPDKGTAIAHNIAQSMDKMIIVSKRGRSKRADFNAIKSLYAKPEVSDPLLVII